MLHQPAIPSTRGNPLATPNLFLPLTRQGVREAGGLVMAEKPDALMFGMTRGGRKFPGFALLSGSIVQLTLECAVCLPGLLAAEMKKRLQPLNATRTDFGWVVRTRPEGDAVCGMYTEVSLSAFTPAAFAGAVRRMLPEVIDFDNWLAGKLAAYEEEQCRTSTSTTLPILPSRS